MKTLQPKKPIEKIPTLYKLNNMQLNQFLKISVYELNTIENAHTAIKKTLAIYDNKSKYNETIERIHNDEKFKTNTFKPKNYFKFRPINNTSKKKFDISVAKIQNDLIKNNAQINEFEKSIDKYKKVQLYNDALETLHFINSQYYDKSQYEELKLQKNKIKPIRQSIKANKNGILKFSIAGIIIALLSYTLLNSISAMLAILIITNLLNKNLIKTLIEYSNDKAKYKKSLSPKMQKNLNEILAKSELKPIANLVTIDDLEFIYNNPNANAKENPNYKQNLYKKIEEYNLKNINIDNKIKTYIKNVQELSNIFEPNMKILRNNLDTFAYDLIKRTTDSDGNVKKIQMEKDIDFIKNIYQNINKNIKNECETVIEFYKNQKNKNNISELIPEREFKNSLNLYLAYEIVADKQADSWKDAIKYFERPNLKKSLISQLEYKRNLDIDVLIKRIATDGKFVLNKYNDKFKYDDINKAINIINDIYKNPIIIKNK